MTAFFNSISQIMNQPEDASVRNLAVLQGVSLTQNINNMAERVETLRKDLNDQVFTISDNINSLVEDIRALNVKIAETEGGIDFQKRRRRLARSTQQRSGKPLATDQHPRDRTTGRHDLGLLRAEIIWSRRHFAKSRRGAGQRPRAGDGQYPHRRNRFPARHRFGTIARIDRIPRQGAGRISRSIERFRRHAGLTSSTKSIPAGKA